MKIKMRTYDHYKIVPEAAEKIIYKKKKPHLMAVVDEDNYTGWQVCVPFCPVDCIEVREDSIQIDNSVCIDCDLCIYICPIEVLESTVET